jgi:hypothetical protein
MIASGFLFKTGTVVIAAGFVEFYNSLYTGASQTVSINNTNIPSGVTRVRVHLIGAGGLSDSSGGTDGGSSTFSAAGVSVIATGGYTGKNTPNWGYGGAGGSVSRVAGVVGAGTGGAGGNPFGTSSGGNGSIGIEGGGIGMGGGGGEAGYIGCCTQPSDPASGTGGVGLLPGYGRGGNGGGYGSGQTLPAYSSNGGQVVGGPGGNAGGGAGAYAMFYAPLIGATTYTNAITLGGQTPGLDPTRTYLVNSAGYCRIEWGPGI